MTSASPVTHDRRTRVFALWALMSLAFSVLSCGGTPQPRRYFSLAPPAPESGRGSAPPTLRIRELECASAYDQAGIIFRVSAVEIRSFRYATWTAAPGIMLSEVLRRYFSSSGRFIVVDGNDTAELELTGRIDVIEQVREQYDVSAAGDTAREFVQQ